MNTTSTTERRHSPPGAHTAHATHRNPNRAPHRVSIFDRAALHLGLALIRWGRRVHRERARDELSAKLAAQHLTHLQHEAARAAYEDVRTRVIMLTIR